MFLELALKALLGPPHDYEHLSNLQEHCINSIQRLEARHWSDIGIAINLKDIEKFSPFTLSKFFLHSLPLFCFSNVSKTARKVFTA